jgi:hypothetical protein
MSVYEIVVYSKSEEDKADLSGRCNSRERKRPYSRVLYLVWFDTSLESKIQNKQISVTSIK